MKKIVNVAIVTYYTYDNKILLQKRDSISKFWEKWAEFGWKMEDWEEPIECLKREIKEELDYEENDLVFIWEADSNRTEEHTNHLYLFASELTKEKLEKFTVLEWDWMQLFNIDDAFDLDFGASIDWTELDALRKIKKYLVSNK